MALTNLSIAYPVYQSVSNSPEFFFVHESHYIHVIALALILSFALPLVIGSIPVLLMKVSIRIGNFISFAIVAVLVALIALPAFKSTATFWGSISVVLAIVAGILCAESYRRFPRIREFCSFLIPAIVVVPSIFLFASEVSKTVFHHDGPAPTSVKKKDVPIVFLVLDEFPVTSIMDQSLQIDEVRFPNFARLQKSSTWFRNATTHNAYTTAAITSILTGTIPKDDRASTIVNYPNNLFTLLHGSYDLRIFESVSRLDPEFRPEMKFNVEDLYGKMISVLADLGIVYLHRILPVEFTGSLPPVNQNWGNFWKDTSDNLVFKRIRLWESFVNSFPKKPDSTLSFLHVLLPHTPWRYLPSGNRYGQEPSGRWGVEGQNRKEEWKLDRWSSVRGLQRHLLQVAFMDRLIGQMLDRLEQNDIYDQSLIIVTADHGISFIPGQHYRKITDKNYQDILPVPLFIKQPGQREGVISDRNVEATDILPTIADLLQINLTWKVDGTSAFETHTPERNSKVALMTVEGHSSRIKFSSLLPEKRNTVDRITEVFGTALPSDQLLNIGPIPEVIGKRVHDIQGRKLELIELMNSKDFERVDTSSGYIPALIAGKVRNSGKPRTIAISINGIVRATTETVSANSEFEDFAALVSESSFQNGRNSIEVYEIEELRAN